MRNAKVCTPIAQPVKMNLRRAFNADCKMLLDIAARGCKLGADGVLILFATLTESVQVITDTSAAVHTTLPEPLKHQLQKF